MLSDYRCFRTVFIGPKTTLVKEYAFYRPTGGHPDDWSCRVTWYHSDSPPVSLDQDCSEGYRMMGEDMSLPSIYRVEHDPERERILQRSGVRSRVHR